VHERDVLADFLLIVLRDLLATRPRLKLILMSATVDATRFATYFGHATPVVHIPGRTFPIAQKYLADVKKLFPKFIPGLFPSDGAPKALPPPLATANPLEAAATAAAAAKMPPGPPESVPVSPSVGKAEADAAIKAVGCFVAELVKQRVKADAALRSGGGGGGAATAHGAILVFLPGAGEIDQAMRETRMALGVGGKGGKGGSGKGSGKGGGKGVGGGKGQDADSPGWLVPLHGALPLRDQRRAFSEAPPNKVKVVFATNVAETSITIPDVDTVVDSGFVKEIR
jgi:HrpA-like RNA helicase